jgi:CHAT domain-containing protein/tetratricopeptide (TPR) repeat protein
VTLRKASLAVLAFAAACSAAAAAPGLQDRARGAPALVELARSEAAAGRSSAIVDFAKAAALYGAAGDRRGQADTIARMGEAQEVFGLFEDALHSARTALELHRTLGDRLHQVSDLVDAGVAEEDLGLYAAALNDQQRALRQAQDSHDRLDAANALGNIGIVQMRLARYDQAMRAHEASLAIDRSIGNRLGEGDELGRIGIADEQLGRYDEALRELGEALAVHRAIHNRRGEAKTLNNIGIVDEHLERYTAALRSHEAALPLFRAIGNRLGEADDLENIGIVDEDLGRYVPALAAHQAAFTLFQELGNRLGQAENLGNTAIVDDDLGRYDESLSALDRSLVLEREIGNRLGEANALGSVGVVYEDLGRYRDALDEFRAALAIHRAIGNLRGQASDLGDVGIALGDLGNLSDAVGEEEKAFELDRTLDNPAGEAADLNNIGNLEERAGQIENALREHERALALDHANNRLGEVEDLCNIGNEQNLLGDSAAALASAREALRLQAGIGAPEALWRALRVAARAEAVLDLRDGAITDYDAAIQHIEALRTSLEAVSERRSFFENKLFVYDEYVAYLLELDRRFPGQGYDRKALDIFERKSARAVLEQVGASAARHFRGVPAGVVAAEHEAGVAADRAQSTLTQLLSTAGSDQTAIASAEQSLAEARMRVATLAASIKAQYPAYYELRHPQPLAAQCRQSPCPTIVDFQQSVLRPGELTLVYDLLEKQSALWLIDRDRVQLVPLSGSAEIARAVTRLGAHVAGMLALLGQAGPARLERGAAADLPGFTSDSYALYRLLVPDAAAAAIARAKSLIVVPTRALYGLAFETLVSRDPSAAPQPHYLIEDLPISYVPSASLLSVVRTSYAQRDAARNPLLAFANPAFGADDPAAARGLSRYASLELDVARSAFRGGPGAATIGEADFPPLPGTETEAAAVRDALGAPEASLVTGDAATRRHVLELNAADSLKTYRYVLFATHAVLPNQIRGLTQPAIVLAHPERGDGLLTMADVFDLALDADFVTLSACSTGVAEGEASGEGISGLTRAFLYAGTPAISVTLWEVYDEAAPRITPSFFAGMHAGKLTASEALRQAKLAMLKSPEARFRHPYAWGPSVIFGDGSRRE